ncbi:hypothetical protein SDC9_62026 [bioreactor metagenome]|uniref:Uncharacterized protein n=1 Tax=bioreactor metagenome TaxID=1076179 RepID=A0A644XHH7_9ZZZZ
MVIVAARAQKADVFLAGAVFVQNTVHVLFKGHLGNEWIRQVQGPLHPNLVRNKGIKPFHGLCADEVQHLPAHSLVAVGDVWILHYVFAA